MSHPITSIPNSTIPVSMIIIIITIALGLTSPEVENTGSNDISDSDLIGRIGIIITLESIIDIIHCNLIGQLNKHLPSRTIA